MTPQAGAALLCDVLHESSYDQCTMASDTCATSAPANELWDILQRPNDPAAQDAWHRKWYRMPELQRHQRRKPRRLLRFLLP